MKARAVERHRAATVGIAFGRHRPRIHPTAFITEGTYVIVAGKTGGHRTLGIAEPVPVAVPGMPQPGQVLQPGVVGAGDR